MQVISSRTKINFMGMRHVWLAVSAVLILFSIYAWVMRGESRFGVDFLGGAELVVKFSEPVSAGDLRKVLEENGVAGAVVQAFSDSQNEFSLRTPATNGKDTGAQLQQVLNKLGKKYEVRKEDYVGPVIGEQIRRDGMKAIIASLIGILIYVTIRFEFIFAMGAVFALFHDVIIATGGLLLSGREIGAGVLAALLTLVGYSINDTIIIFDRVRENYALAQRTSKKPGVELHKELSMFEIINISVNQTLSRTILTSVTVFFVCMALWLLGGGAVEDLAFTLTVGVVVGTYSSVFIACALALMMGGGKALKGAAEA